MFKLSLKSHLLYTLLVAVLFVGCKKSSDKCLENVKDAFPNSKIYQLKGDSFTFIIVDTLGVKKVICTNTFDCDISGVRIAHEK
mgnify:CR=1 FL=1